MTRQTRKALRDWMRKGGWSQADVAGRVGVTQATISRMVRGDLEIGLEVAMRLSDLTGIEADALLSDPTAKRILKDYVTRLLSEHGIAKDTLNVA